MRIGLRYSAQLRSATGCASEQIELAEACSLLQLPAELAERHGERLQKLVFDATGKPTSKVLVFLGDEQVRWDAAIQLQDGDVVTLLMPMSGG